MNIIRLEFSTSQTIWIELDGSERSRLCISAMQDPIAHQDLYTSLATLAATRTRHRVGIFSSGTSLAGVGCIGNGNWAECRISGAYQFAFLRSIFAVAVIFNNASRPREVNVYIFSGNATIHVGDENRRKCQRLFGCVVRRIRRRLISHSNGCAVHVHLSIADTIKPCPGQGVFPGCNTVRDREVELERMVRLGTPIKISGSFCRASPFVGLDDFPFRILCRLTITGEAHLAGPTAMGGAAQKLDGIVAPSPISRLFSRNDKVTWGYLARKVTTICCKWRVVKCLPTRSVGFGRGHSQVRIGRRKCNCLQK